MADHTAALWDCGECGFSNDATAICCLIDLAPRPGSEPRLTVATASTPGPPSANPSLSNTPAQLAAHMARMPGAELRQKNLRLLQMLQNFNDMSVQHSIGCVFSCTGRLLPRRRRLLNANK